MKILLIRNHPQKAEEKGRAARKYVEEVHNMEQFVADIKVEVQRLQIKNPLKRVTII